MDNIPIPNNVRNNFSIVDNLDNLDNINNYIDQSNNHLTHYDVALIVYKVFKQYYRYIGNNNWEYFDKIENIWKKDNKKKKLKFDIKTIIADLFINRALYWYNASLNVCDINTENHVNFMAQKMIRASNKIKNDIFVSTVIKEATAFFDIYNNE